MPSSSLFTDHFSFCGVALGVGGYRSIPTPTSLLHRSTTQRGYHAEEDPLMRIPRQQTIDQPMSTTHDLARQTHERIRECLELQTQHPTLLLPLLLLLPTRFLRQGQPEPRLQVPRQRRHHHVRPVALQRVYRRPQRPHPAVQLTQHVLLIAPIVALEHD